MKYLLALCVSLLVACSSCAAPKRLKYYSDADYIGHEASMRIWVTCFDGRRSLGSGVAINSNTVLTALHVTMCDDEPAAEVKVIDLNGNEFLVTNEVNHDGVDITKLTVAGEPFKVWATPLFRTPRVGETICWYGGDGFKSNRGTKKCGYYEGTKDFEGTSWHMHMVSGKASPGNSGSGVFDLNGNLIGILNLGQWDSDYDFAMGFTLIEKAP
jgi:trypsin-like peptidase